MAAKYGIVNYVGGGGSGHACGYCKSSTGFVTHGMLAYKLTCQNLQDLTDKGWRRSGQYCYLPTNDKMCCPLHIIRCDAGNFKISKSQKKVLKTVNKFLLTGDRKQKVEQEMADERTKMATESVQPDQTTASSSASAQKVVRKSSGPDPSKPPARKAKDIRRERALLRQQAKTAGSVDDTAMASSSKSAVAAAKGGATAKTLEEFIALPKTDSPPAHVLEVKIVQSSPRSAEFDASFKESYQLYRKYQMTVHKDPPHKITEKSFIQFLVDSPLIPEPGPKEWDCGYGSYHCQYYMDGKLIMVGVFDILPNCLSSVYVYYDTDYNFLSPGVYSALKELALVRKFLKVNPKFKYYCMGYYVHDCQKMRYKGNYSPSSLLCSKTHRYIPIETCLPKLDQSKYCQFDDEPRDPEMSVDNYMDSVLVLYYRQAMPYEVFKQVAGDHYQEEVREYAQLVGKGCSTSCLLILQ